MVFSCAKPMEAGSVSFPFFVPLHPVELYGTSSCLRYEHHATGVPGMSPRASCGSK
ncbi:MAG: hypothetical protein IPJ09_10255 [Saprospiraceae bacterium]|nr:hypothetical protein [Saprospiraceae bacterium]